MNHKGNNNNTHLRVQMGCLCINNKIHPLYKGLNVIGRNRTATVILRDQAVSQHHAIITIVDENQHFISDMGSFNGTFIEQNKLQPLKLNEVLHDAVIHFAGIAAIYKKTPSDSQPVVDHNCSGSPLEAAEHTQNLSESFYAAQTQALENVTDAGNSKEPLRKCFEDGYNFDDVLSPPLHDVSIVNQSELATAKAGQSIHELPTQIFCSDIKSVVSVGERQVEISAEGDAKPASKKIDLHDLPTQIICHEVAENVCIGETDTEDALFAAIIVPCDNNDSTKNLDSKPGPSSHNSVSKGNASDDIHNAITQRDAIHYKLTQPIKKSSVIEKDSKDSDLSDSLKSPIYDSGAEKFTVDDTTDLIEDTVLSDSGLDATIHSSQDNPVPSLATEEKASSSLEPESQLCVGQLRRRALKPISDDTEEDDANSGSDVVRNKPRQRKKLLSESSSENSDLERASKQKKRSRMSQSARQVSDSETDIEDQQRDPAKFSMQCTETQQNLSKEESDSATEIEDLEAAPVKCKRKTKKATSKNATATGKSSGSGSETDVENYATIEETSSSPQNIDVVRAKVIKDDVSDILHNKARQDSKQNCTSMEHSGSDTDMDDTEPGISNKLVEQKIETSSEKKQDQSAQNTSNLKDFNESDIIPSTQESDDDTNDFNLMLDGLNSTGNKDIMENTEGSIIDISQKLNQLRKNSVIPQECSEESINLALTEFDSTENITEKSKDDIADDDKTPDISDTEGVAMPDKNSLTKQDDDIFTKATQKLTPICSGSKASQSKLQTKETAEKTDKDNTQNAFEMETQEMAGELLYERDDEVFLKPGISRCSNIKRKETTQTVQDDTEDFFMQPTQPVLEAEGGKHSKSTYVAVNSHSSSVVDENSIFMQPTQKFILHSQDADQRTLPNKDDIFDQPTQAIIVDKPNEPIFMQPTQPVVLSPQAANKTDCESEIFMQPTQVIEVKAGHPSSLKHSPRPRSKVEEIESQLEVMFASQTPRPNSQVDSRPSNPLVNVLEGKQSSDALHNSEEFITDKDEHSYLPKSPESDHSGSFKEYCDRPTLPLGDLTDIVVDNDQPNLKSDVEECRQLSSETTKGEETKSPETSKNQRRQSKRGQNKCEETDSTYASASTRKRGILSKSRNADSSRSESSEGEDVGNIKKKRGRPTKITSTAKNIEISINVPEHVAQLQNETTNSRSTDMTDERVMVDSDKDAVEQQKSSVTRSSRRNKVDKTEDGDKKSEQDKTKEVFSVKLRSKKTYFNQQTSMSETPQGKETANSSSHSQSHNDVINVDTHKNTGKQQKKELHSMEETKGKDMKNEEDDAKETFVIKMKAASVGSSQQKNISETLQRKKALKNQKVSVEGIEGSRSLRLKKINVHKTTSVVSVSSNSSNESISESDLRSAKVAEENIVGQNKASLHASAANRINESVKKETRGNKTKIETTFQEGHSEEREVNTQINKRLRTVTVGIPASIGSERKIARNEPTKSSNADQQQHIPETPQRKTRSRAVCVEPEKQTLSKVRNLRGKNVDVNKTTSIITVHSEDSEDSSSELEFATARASKQRKVNKNESQYNEEAPRTANESISKENFNTRRGTKGSKAHLLETTHPKKQDVPSTPASSDKFLNATGRRNKRLANTINEKDKETTPSKKNKMIESSSENEEINLQTPSTSRHMKMLNVTVSTPDRNRRKQKPKVVFTMLDSPELESLIRSLGGMVVDSIDSCTVLVTGNLKRTQKLLSAIGQGKPICSPVWLQECKKANQFLDPWDFILEDKEAERKWNLSLKESLNRSLRNKLLGDFTIYLAVTNALDVLKAAIEYCGGKWITKAPTKRPEGNFLIVANPENKTKFSKYLKQSPPVNVVLPEAILDGVLRQELHLKDHMITL